MIKKFCYTLLIFFSFCINAQSEKIKELQDKIEYWKSEYSFVSYVLDRDKNVIYSEKQNSGIVSGVYAQWDSLSDNRQYEYIFTPYAGTEYGKTVTLSRTIYGSYSKESYEEYKKMRVDEVFKEIDEQLSVEKKEQERIQANAEKNRKKEEHINNQLKNIESHKDSLLLTIDSHHELFTSWISKFKSIDEIIKQYVKENHPFLNMIESASFSFYNLVEYDKRNLEKNHLIKLFSNVNYCSLINKENCKQVSLSDAYTRTYGDDVYANTVGYKTPEGNTRILYNLLLGTELSKNFIELFQFIYMTDITIWNKIEKRSYYFYNPDDFKKSDGMNVNYSYTSYKSYNAKNFHNALYYWYAKSNYNAKKLGYDFNLESPIKDLEDVNPDEYYKLSDLQKMILNEVTFNSNLINQVLSTSYLDENGDWTDKIVQDLLTIENVVRTVNEISKLNTWIDRLEKEVVSNGFLKKGRLNKILKNTYKNFEAIDQSSKKHYEEYLGLFFEDIYKIHEFKKITLEEFKVKLIEAQKLIKNEYVFPLDVLLLSLEQSI